VFPRLAPNAWLIDSPASASQVSETTGIHYQTQLHSFVFGYLAGPGAFVEETILFPLNGFSICCGLNVCTLQNSKLFFGIPGV
jgi:hypothetical protein